MAIIVQGKLPKANQRPFEPLVPLEFRMRRRGLAATVAAMTATTTAMEATVETAAMEAAVEAATVEAATTAGPTMPAATTAPAQSLAPGIAAPVEARALPGAVVPAIVPAAEEELGLLDAHEVGGGLANRGLVADRRRLRDRDE